MARRQEHALRRRRRAVLYAFILTAAAALSVAVTLSDTLCANV